jgi:restriction system protein
MSSIESANVQVSKFESEFECETQIIEFISYNGLDLARFVEEILLAQGYRTQASPCGAAGVYISACGAIGPLGFALPPISAFVRPINRMEDPSFDDLGAFKALSDSGNSLFASWLYFSDETQEEASRLFDQVKFWNIGDVVRALTANYEKTSDELKSYIPLKRIWTLVATFGRGSESLACQHFLY